MRNNGAVSDHEVVLRDDQVIITRTDERGIIVFANPDFIEVSGFSEEELLGQPQNVVRHPDMPAAVFADLWRDIQAGRPWVGLIKNRCKNGNFYWVEAHVSPLKEGDEISGYMSMRRKPTARQIADAEAAYAALLAPERAGLTFEHGHLVRKHAPAELWRKASLGAKFLLISLLAALAILIVAAYFLATHVTRKLDENAREQLTHDVGLLRAAVSSRIESANIEAIEYSKVLADRIYDELGGQEHTTLPKLTALLDRKASSASIQALLAELPSTGTVFLLTPEGFQRRLSTAHNETGQPVIGTYLATDHPAYLLLQAGQTYVGPARVFGRLYVTRYSPIRDHTGAVIGASVVGIEITKQLAPLKEQIRSMRVGNSGYYYIVDASPGQYFGDLILHPYKEGKSLSDFRITETEGLVTEMVRRKHGEISYFWQNEEAGEKAPRKKLVIFEMIDMPQWIIAGGTTVEEFGALTQSVVWTVIIGGLLMVGSMLAIVLLLIRKLILAPLNTQVLPTFQAISSGQFDTPLDIRNSDEIGQLIQGLETLRNRIAYDNDRDRTLARMREQARQESEALAKARAEFLANMSHEIRTPLNGVIGLSYLLLQSKLPSREMEYIRRIEGAGKLLLALVNDVLDFSKIDAGGMQFEETDFELDDVLDNLSSLVRTRAQEKKLVLDYVVSPDVPPTLHGDALRLSQILINLVGNAIKFTAEGGITLYVDCFRRSDGKAELNFRIQDTGIGIDPEQQAKLFQPFTQADNSFTRKFGGTGLGLVITKRLIEMMGGTIGIDSTPKVGSTFYFSVTLGIGERVVHADLPISYRVLVVDDQNLARTVLSRLLQKHGCSVETDASGNAALSRLENDEKPFDCIMIDLHMPGIDGLALAGMLRTRLGKSTRLVMVSSENPNSATLRGSLDIFDEFVEKPVTSTRIREVLTHLRGQPGLTHPATATVDAAPLAGVRILVAEDVPTNQLIIRDLLESLGATVLLADNGHLTLQALADNSDEIDLILMDIQMPEMDGLEATRRIRQGSVRADIPIIALTAHALAHEHQRANDVGMNDFLTKPIEPLKLLEMIRRYAKARPAASTILAGEAQHIDGSPSHRSEAPAATAFREITGIDTVDGLRRMMNKAALYEKVLRDFGKRFAGETERIRQALATEDRDTAARMAHTVKGTGGTIGAQALFVVAKDLEESIKAATADLPSRLAAFDNELTRVLSGIQSAFPPK